MAIELEKPLPRPTPVTRPFWDSLREGQIRLQRCDDCGRWVFYPRSHCNHCLSDALSWHEVAGNGTLHTYTIARQPTSPHFAGDVPQYLAVVELEEGVRLTSTLVNVTEQDIHIGMALRPVFDRVSDDATLLRFEPA